MNHQQLNDPHSAARRQQAGAAFSSVWDDELNEAQHSLLTSRPFNLMKCIIYLRSKCMVILLCGFLCVLLAGLALCVITPKYEATSKLYILTNDGPGVTLSALQSGTLLMADYREVFKTWEVHEAVRSQLGLDMTYREMQKMLTVQIPDGSRLLYITVKHADPVFAAELANAYAQAGYTFITQSLKGLEPNLFSSAIVPGKAVGMGTAGFLLCAFAAGVSLSACGYAVFFCLDNKIHTPEDLQLASGLPVLADLPVRTLPGLTVEEKEKACLLASRLLLRKCVLVTAPHHEDGVSFVCADLLQAMAAEYRKALWIRVEHRPFWNHTSIQTLKDYLEERCGWAELVHPFEGGWLLPVCGTEDELPSQLFHPRMAELMKELRAEYDIILVDVPPMDRCADGMAFLAFCDGMLVIASCGQSRFEDISSYIRVLAEANCPLLGAVLNRAGSKAAAYTPFAAHRKAGASV